MKHPEEGDQLWLIHDGYPIVIRVTVLGVDQFGDFVVDEPTGNTVEAECLFAELEEAGDRLLLNVEEAQELWLECTSDDGADIPLGEDDFIITEEYTLKEYRAAQIEWIGQLQEEIDENPHGFDGIFRAKFPDKEDGEWYSARQIRELRGMPISDFEDLYS